MGSSSSTTADRTVVYSREQHEDMIREHGHPVYLLYIDLRWSVGGGFKPQMSRVLRNLATQWGTAGTAMQHWAIMIDGFVYELARKPEGEMADRGMHNNPTFKRPEAIPYREWQMARQVKEVGWRKYFYTRMTKARITEEAQAIAEKMQKYNGLNNNCQHFVTRLYNELGCGYSTTAGWAPMSSEVLPKQMPVVAEMAGNVSDNVLFIAMSGMAAVLTAAI